MPNLKLQLFPLLLFQFLLFSIANAQVATGDIDELVSEALKTFNVAGTAVAIVKDGKVIHNKGYGVTSVKLKEKVNADTRFAIASNSKAFTAAALAILIDEGKLDWSDKVVDYIPELQFYDH